MSNINEKIISKAKELEDYLISTRRYLHENPELSEKEFETAKFLKSEIEKLGLEIVDCVDSPGFIGILDTGKPGKTVGIRADMDALPVMENESNLAGKRKCISSVDGVMHACGHDGHMAMNLGTAKVLTDLKEELSGKVIFIFESAEENGGGIEQMISLLKNYEIDAIYGTHLSIMLDTGKISMDPGPVMAGCYSFDFDVVGRGGHGSRPDLSISPIFPAAHIVTNLGSAWANQLDVTETVTLGLGSIQSGNAANVIPDRAKINGTLRYFNIAEGTKAAEIVRKTAKLTAEVHNCHIDMKFEFAGNPVINDEEMAKLGQNALEDILPGSLARDVTWFASESFNRYGDIAPSVFAFVGTKNPEVGSGAEHHNEYFDIDEGSLYYGTVAASKFAVEVLNS